MLAIRMALRLHSGSLANIQPGQRFNPRAAGVAQKAQRAAGAGSRVLDATRRLCH